MAEQSSHPVGADFGGGVKPAKGSDAGEVRREDVLQEAAHPIERFQQDGGVLAGFAVAIRPSDFTVGLDVQEAVGGGGFEDVTGKVTERVFAGTGRLATDVPMALPNLGRDLGEEFGMFLAEVFLEKGATVIAQRSVMEEELGAGGHPLATVRAEAAGGNEIMDMGMENEGASPSVQDPKHAQLSTETAGMAGQILQSLGSGGKEEIEGDLQMGPDEEAQLLGHGEGDQEVGHGQQEAGALSLEPGVGVGLAALRTVPVVAGMIAVMKAWTVRTLEELAAQSGGAAGQDLFQDLPLPPRHGRA